MVASGNGNSFPRGQCTWWADERYHQLTGLYVPWSGDAWSWSGNARAAGWKVSAKPVVPSIIVLQSGVQGAAPPYGHVAIVERINPDGSVYTSDLNWGSQTQTTNVTFKPGPGVSFVYASSKYVTGGTPGGVPSGTPAPGVTGVPVSDSTGSYTPLLQQIHQTLIDTPGFYGIAKALDEAEQFPGYVNLSTGAFDVTGQIRSIGASLADNFVPFVIRSGLFMLGLLLLIALILKAVEGPVEKAAPALLAAL